MYGRAVNSLGQPFLDCLCAQRRASRVHFVPQPHGFRPTRAGRWRALRGGGEAREGREREQSLNPHVVVSLLFYFWVRSQRFLGGMNRTGEDQIAGSTFV